MGATPWRFKSSRPHQTLAKKVIDNVKEMLYNIKVGFKHDAPVAQLDRASDYGSEGYGFDSFRARHITGSSSAW